MVKKLIKTALVLALVIGGTIFGFQQLANAIIVNNVTPNNGLITGGQTITITGDFDLLPKPATMQQMTQEYCASMDVYDGTPATESAILTLKDSRNNQPYQIAKLADNNCWMLSNLKIANLAVTDQDTDLHTTTTFTIPDFDNLGTPDYDSPRVYGPVDGDTGTPETNYGYLYNWSAATAGESRITMPDGSGNAPNSICPRGWRLPSGNPGGDFAELDVAFGGPGVYDMSGSSVASYSNSGPFKGVFSGMWSDGFSSQGYAGFFWASSAFSGDVDAAHSLFFDSSETGPISISGRESGFAVRCIIPGGAPTTLPPPTVTIDGIPATIVSWDNSSIIIVTQPHAAGLVDVVVTRGSETITVVDGYEYIKPVVPGVPNTGYFDNEVNYKEKQW